MSRLDAPIDIICNLTLHCKHLVFTAMQMKDTQTKHMDVSLGKYIRPSQRRSYSFQTHGWRNYAI